MTNQKYSIGEYETFTCPQCNKDSITFSDDPESYRDVCYAEDWECSSCHAIFTVEACITWDYTVTLKNK